MPDEELTPVTPGLDLSLFGDEHVRRYEETDGEVGYLWNGAPCLVLTTTGRRSGQARKIPIIFGTDGDDVVLVGSQGGAPTHPNWYLNLLADPHARVQIRDEVRDVVATPVEGAERTRLWRMMNEVWPAYDTYQERTDRVIPVVRLARSAS